jgi:hypothetical protein
MAFLRQRRAECLRSSPAGPSHLGCWLTPHQVQNPVAVWTACPQAAQMLSTPAPQFGQNRLPREVTESHCVLNKDHLSELLVEH